MTSCPRCVVRMLTCLSMRAEDLPCNTWHENYLIASGEEDRPYVEPLINVSKDACAELCMSKTGCSGATLIEVQDGPNAYTACEFWMTGPERSRVVNMDLVRELTGDDYADYAEDFPISSFVVCNPSAYVGHEQNYGYDHNETSGYEETHEHPHEHKHVHQDGSSFVYTHYHPHSHGGSSYHPSPSYHYDPDYAPAPYSHGYPDANYPTAAPHAECPHSFAEPGIPGSKDISERFHIEDWDQEVAGPEVVSRRVDLFSAGYTRVVNGVGIGSLHASAATVR